MLQKKNINLFHHSLAAMNTQLDLVFWGAEQNAYATTLNQISNQLEQLESTISRYATQSELFLLNQQGHLEPVKVSDTLWNAILQGQDYYNKSNGYFDISLGTIFHQHKKDKTNSFRCSGSFSDRIKLNTEDHSIQFRKEDVSIDFGGMGKGIALSLFDIILQENSITNAFISFGGSSILTRGTHPYGDHWPFGLANQKDNIPTWKLNNDCLSISSSHQQAGEESSTHIIDIKHHHAIKVHKTAIVQSNDPVEAEVLSTTLIACPTEEHQCLVQHFNNPEFCII